MNDINTVSDLIEALSKLEPNALIGIWNPEWDMMDCIQYIAEDEDGYRIVF